MPMVIILRVLAVMAVTLGIMLVTMALFDPKKTAIDVVARALIWAIVSIVAWSQAALHEKFNP